MRKLFLTALALSLLCAPFAGCTETEIQDDNPLSFRESIGGTYILSGIGTCTDEEITVPATYKGKPVIAVGTYAFLNNETIKKVTIAEGVKRVDDSAFKNCDTLESVSLPSTLEKIAGGAFSDCNALTEVVFAENSKIETIGGNAFESCTTLESISFPVSLVKLDNYSFMNCSSLKDVGIPEGTNITSIGWAAFWGCASLTQIRIPGAITYMEWATFRDCNSLERAYVGTKEEFAQMTYNSGNDLFKAARKYYYSEERPTGWGYYWHFVDGKITVWE